MKSHQPQFKRKNDILQDQLQQEHIPQCPSCDTKLDGFTSLTSNRPKDGDITLCIYCMTPLVFEEVLGELHLRKAKDDEMTEVDHKQLAMAREAIEAFNAKRRH